MSISKNEWQQLSLGSLLESITAGTSTGGEDRRVSKNECGVLTLSSIVSGVFDPTQHKAVALNLIHKLTTPVKAETIIISRSNTINLVGTSAYIDKDYPNLFLSDLLWELKPKESSELIPQWLGYALASPKVRLELKRRASGTSGSMKKLSMVRLRSVILEVPPIHIQKLTCLLLERLNFVIKITNDLIAAKRSLKQGLMQQLLTGKRRFPEFEKSRQKQDAPIGLIPKDWQLVKIGEIAKEISEKGAPEGTTVLSCTKHNGLVSSLEYFGRQIFSQNLDTYKVVKRKQFAGSVLHLLKDN